VVLWINILAELKYFPSQEPQST